MKDYFTYTVEDFASDESYLRYYFKEDSEDVRFWTEWISLHPEKLDVVMSANNYIDAFSVRLSHEEIQQEEQRLAEALQNHAEEPSWFQRSGGVNDDSYLAGIEVGTEKSGRWSMFITIAIGQFIVLPMVVYLSVFYTHKVSNPPSSTQKVFKQDSLTLQKMNETTGTEKE